jgi:hypothetical protein
MEYLAAQGIDAGVPGRILRQRYSERETAR